jgi:hypothetical protein
MSNKKFYYGDTVVLRHERYSRHDGHTGQIVGTRILKSYSGSKSTIVSYRVACECGMKLLPLAIHMDLVSTPLEKEPMSPENARLHYFMRYIGMQADQEILREQVDAALGILNDQYRTVVTQRFGLNGGDGHTLEAIALGLSKSKQYIHQVEKRALQKLRSFPGLSRNSHAN